MTVIAQRAHYRFCASAGEAAGRESFGGAGDGGGGWGGGRGDSNLCSGSSSSGSRTTASQPRCGFSARGSHTSATHAD